MGGISFFGIIQKGQLGFQPKVMAYHTLVVGGMLFLSVLLSGCASQAPIYNEPEAALYVPEKHPAFKRSVMGRPLVSTSWAGGMKQCPPAGTANYMDPPTKPVYPGFWHFPKTLHFSKGDIINLTIREGKEFEGDYTVGVDGNISIPYIGRVQAAGKSESDLEKDIRHKLIKDGLFLKKFVRVSARIIKYAPIKVSITGAVFFPGYIEINGALKSGTPEIKTFGDVGLRRRLSHALRGAYGVRPDADLSAVLVKRRGIVYQFDLRGAITGHITNDIALEEGDEVFVSPSNCFQSALVRPSIVTPKGIRIFLSHMAKGHEAKQNQDAKIPYGMRLLRGAIIANCVGGSRASNGRRHVVLVSTNPKTRKTEVVQRSVEELIRHSERDEINPVLMPDDGIACYDSDFSEVYNFMSYVGNIIGNYNALP